MSDIPDIDPTKPEDQGAAGGGDDNPQDWSLPGGPPSPPPRPLGSKLKDFWKEITGKGKGPYQKVPQDDKGTPMATLPPEKKGLPSTPKDPKKNLFHYGGAFRASFDRKRHGNTGG